MCNVFKMYKSLGDKWNYDRNTKPFNLNHKHNKLYVFKTSKLTSHVNYSKIMRDYTNNQYVWRAS
jgi:hypothetical protein